MGDWAPTRYPTDEDPSPSPYGPQFPWSGYPAAPTLSDLVDLSPTPTDVILFSSLDTGVGRYYSSVAILPAASSTSELPPYMESIPTRTPEPPPVQTTEVTTPQHEESTISSEIIPADETSESITMTRLATTSPTTTSDLSSIPQNTSDATTDSLTTSPNRDNANHKKLAIAITVPIVIVLLVALGATFFLLRRRRRKRTKKASSATVAGSSSEADTLANDNGDSSLHSNGRHWGTAPTASHDMTLYGPTPRKPVPLVTLHEPTSPMPRSGSHTLQGNNSQTPRRGIEPHSQPDVTGSRHLPLINTKVAAEEVTGGRSPPRSTFYDPDPEDGAVSDISDRAEGGNARDLADMSPVSSISEEWDQAFPMRYTAGRAAHVHIHGDHPRPPN